MILTVTLNASIDKRYVADKFVVGSVNRVLTAVYTPGGKGLNVSKAAVIAGAQVTATGFTGGYAGAYIEQALGPLGIVSDFYRLEAESRSCINIWDEQNQTQTEFLEPGFAVTEADFAGFLCRYDQLLSQAGIVVLSGSVPKGLDGSAYSELIIRAGEKGRQVILDTSGTLLEQGMNARPSLIKPNIDEIRMLTGKDCQTKEEIITAAKEIHKWGIEKVVVSLGSKGALAVSSEGAYEVHVPEITAVNTVGCGDTMIAGFAIGMQEKLPFVDILKRASAMSAAAALSEETGYYRREDMEKLLPEISIQGIL